MKRNASFEEECRRLSLSYQIAEDKFQKMMNQESFQRIKELLSDVGVNLRVDMENSTLRLSINGSKYYRVVKRGAGSCSHAVHAPKDLSPNDGTNFCTYADVVYLLSSGLNNTQLRDKLKMSNGSYWRHKRNMVQSIYYKSLDKERLGDLDYLRGLPGNRYF